MHAANLGFNIPEQESTHALVLGIIYEMDRVSKLNGAIHTQHFWAT